MSSELELVLLKAFKEKGYQKQPIPLGVAQACNLNTSEETGSRIKGKLGHRGIQGQRRTPETVSRNTN